MVGPKRGQIYFLHFGRSLTGDYMSRVNPGVSVEHALKQASLLLSGAATLASESQDAEAIASQNLNWVAWQLVEMSKGLVDASLENLFKPE